MASENIRNFRSAASPYFCQCPRVCFQNR